MIREVLNQYPYPWLASIILVLFWIIFIGVLFFNLRKGSTRQYQDQANIPFQTEPFQTEKEKT